MKIGDWVRHVCDYSEGKILNISSKKHIITKERLEPSYIYTILFNHVTPSVTRKLPKWDIKKIPTPSERIFEPLDKQKYTFVENDEDIRENTILLRENLVACQLGAQDRRDLEAIVRKIHRQLFTCEFNVRYIVPSNEETSYGKTLLDLVLDSWEMRDGKFRELLPSMLRLQLLKIFMDGGCGGKDTIPKFVCPQSPYVFRKIIKGFRGSSQTKALCIALESGLDAEMACWEYLIEQSSYQEGTQGSRLVWLREKESPILNCLVRYLPDPECCAVCYFVVGYKISCCSTRETTNRICFGCYGDISLCPFCRKYKGVLVNPIHERLINNLLAL